MRQRMEKKICTKCKHELPINRFNKKSAATPQRRSMCRNCERDYNREYKAAMLTRMPKSTFVVDALLVGWVMRHARVPRNAAATRRITGHPVSGMYMPKTANDDNDLVRVVTPRRSVLKKPLFGHPTWVLYGG